MTRTIPETVSGTWYYSEPVASQNGQPRPKLDPEAERGWDEVIDKLLVIRGYENNWDGEGSRAPQLPLVDSAIRLAITLRENGERPADFVGASDGGTVYFEWISAEGYREIEVINADGAESRWVATGSLTTDVKTLFLRRI